MARPIRLLYPYALYHVVARGNNRQPIYSTSSDYRRFLRILRETIERYQWKCAAYCLMPNHYHLLIQTPNTNLPQGMKHLNGVYALETNKIHKRVGHIFQGRYQAHIIEEDSYALNTARYILHNPVKAGLCKHPADWLWTSWMFTIHPETSPTWFYPEFVPRFFHQQKATSINAFVDFLSQQPEEPYKPPPQHKRPSITQGSKQYLDWLNESHNDQEWTKEIPKQDRLINRLSLAELFGDDKNIKKDERNWLIFVAHVYAGYTQKAVADFLKIHYTTVSRIINEGKIKYRKMKLIS